MDRVSAVPAVPAAPIVFPKLAAVTPAKPAEASKDKDDGGDDEEGGDDDEPKEEGLLGFWFVLSCGIDCWLQMTDLRQYR